MLHRHLNDEHFSIAAIDDVIARGRREDWARLGLALLADPGLAEKVRRVCRPNVIDPYAQRYHFLMNYVEERFAS